MVDLILFLIGLGVAVTVETLNSLFWLTSFMLKLFGKYPGHFTVLQHCMHGGTRDKKSKFWSYNPRKPDTNILESLGILCDGQHQHDSWKPRWVDGKLLFGRPKKPLTYNFVPAICFRLSRRSQVPWPQPLPELATTAYGGSKRWKEEFVYSTEQRQQAETSFGRIWTGSNRRYSSWLSAHWQAVARIPKRYQRYPSLIALGFTRDEWRRKSSTLVSSIEEGAHFEVLTLGIPRDPADFIKDAHEIGHPRRAFARVPALMREALEEVFLGDPFEIKSKRADFLKNGWKELSNSEQKSSNSMPVSLRTFNPCSETKSYCCGKRFCWTFSTPTRRSWMKCVRVSLDGVGPVFGRFPD